MKSISSLRLWAGLTTAVLFGGLVAGPAVAAGIGKQERTRAILSTVSIRPLNERGQALKDGACSGTFISPDGLILTSFSCVGRTADASKDPNRIGISPGDLYHPEGLVQVAPTKDERRAPIPAFTAKYLAGNPFEDVAILKVVSGIKRDDTLPEPLAIVFNPLGNSESVDPNDRMHTAGYLEVGGSTVTFTSGAIAGFEDTDGDGDADTFKYDARVGRGLSGGLVMNEQGEQIAVHTSLGEGGIGRGRMVDRAAPYLLQAQGQAAPTPSRTVGPGTPGPTPRPTSTPPAGAAIATVRPPTAMPPPTAPPPAGRTVTLTGRIIDADTKRGIAQAVFVILQPGASLDEWHERGAEVALLTTSTDTNGVFFTAPVPSGQTYSAVFLARGYQARSGEGMIAIGDGATGLVELDALALKKR